MCLLTAAHASPIHQVRQPRESPDSDSASSNSSHSHSGYAQANSHPPASGGNAMGGAGAGTSTWFNSIRGGAANLMKNVKDASSKVVETVSA